MENRILRALIAENSALLRQTEELIGDLTTAQYARHHDALGCSSIGKHARHITGHYEAFLSGCALIDYDDRVRGTAVERCPRSGRQSLRNLGGQLAGWAVALPDAMQSLLVRYTVDEHDAEHSAELQSSVCRELVFLSNHTLHHMAIIGILARAMGVTPVQSFGVARSTRTFLGRQRTAAKDGKCTVEISGIISTGAEKTASATAGSRWSPFPRGLQFIER
jgi:uncharacterized damage-inducible protein DinB